MPNVKLTQAIVIGGGFYGASIAIYLAKERGFKHVLLVEAEPSLLSRASYNNQARAHNGYHYPRSLTTAYRSRINLPKFIRDWPDAVKHDFTKLYAIARQNSKVTARQFERFCNEIEAPIQVAPSSLKGLFESRLIEEVFQVEEYAFDATKLAGWAEGELRELGVNILFNSKVTEIKAGPNNTVLVELRSKSGDQELVSSCNLFNCTYSGLNQFIVDVPMVQTTLKHEVAEMALVKVPPSLEKLGVTVMDGPFFSIMPFPALGLHTLSHVRYTPHLHWIDKGGIDPYLRLAEYDCRTRVDRMIRDVGRYFPSIFDVKYVKSLFEVKTVLVKSEGDDGRPILFERHAELPNCYSVLGGKIDNIYDVLETLDAEEFQINNSKVNGNG